MELTAPTPVHLIHVEPDVNVARFYGVELQPTLFGEVSVLRTRGRVGTNGQAMMVTNDDAAQAGEALQKLEGQKHCRGNIPVSDQNRPSAVVDLSSGLPVCLGVLIRFSDRHQGDVVIPINGRKHWLWPAVDAKGDVLDILVQPQPDAKVARRFLTRLIARYGEPHVVITDKLRSCFKPVRELSLLNHSQTTWQSPCNSSRRVFATWTYPPEFSAFGRQIPAERTHRCCNNCRHNRFGPHQTFHFFPPRAMSILSLRTPVRE
nr:DDE-type integrase/transposase/recombinase [Ruegeria arenilitoris]